jgi:hypothetical protein
MKISGPFTPFTLDLLKSPAWKSLTLEGYKVVTRIAIEHMLHGGRDNGSLIIPYHDFGMHPRQIAKGLGAVEALGIIEIKRGRGGNGEFKAPSTYRLTWLSASGLPPTNEWLKIVSLEDAKTTLKSIEKPRVNSPWLRNKLNKITIISFNGTKKNP